MSFRVISLGKLLRALYAKESDRITLIRKDIREEIKKSKGGASKEGGDFYVPFWADAKGHVAGRIDLRAATPERIAKNVKRTRLYQLLASGFLSWWEEKRRLRNEPFKIIERQIKGRLRIEGVGEIKVENTLSFTIEGHGRRVVYAYCVEDPPLGDEAARVGLYIMSQCIAGFRPEDMRVLDVLRGRTFSSLGTPLLGNEPALLSEKYQSLVDQWEKLRREYP